jgi:hypothetical protein
LYSNRSIAAAAQDAPTFRTGAHLVQISVIVRDANGPVADLTRDDFQLTHRGKLVPIIVFSLEASRGQAPNRKRCLSTRFRIIRRGLRRRR